ncbi:MAG: TIM barrel protein [Silvibacterium sp.]
MTAMRFSRRKFFEDGLKSSLAASLALGASSAKADTSLFQVPAAVSSSRIKQSACRWCYKDMTVEQLCSVGAEIGLKGIDLLEVDEWEIPRKHGLICTMGYAGGGTIAESMNRVENHAAIEAAFRKNIPLAAKAGVPNVITFSGNRKGMSDDEGARNTVLGLNRVKKIAEDNNVTICLELLNSKVNHKDYMADHTAWGAAVMHEVNSPHVKLLYDIYHMQIMEGDLIATITANIGVLGHFHTGGVPGRHQLDHNQEIQYDAVMKGIADAGYQGYVAHEFLATIDPVVALRQAVELCAV